MVKMCNAFASSLRSGASLAIQHSSLPVARNADWPLAAVLDVRFRTLVVRRGSTNRGLMGAGISVFVSCPHSLLVLIMHSSNFSFHRPGQTTRALDWRWYGGVGDPVSVSDVRSSLRVISDALRTSIDSFPCACSTRKCGAPT